MTESPVIWTITAEDAQAAEDALHQERLDTLAVWASRLADVLSTVYGTFRNKLPPQLAHDVTMEYARLLLQQGRDVCADDCVGDDDSDWTITDEDD